MQPRGLQGGIELTYPIFEWGFVSRCLQQQNLSTCPCYGQQEAQSPINNSYQLRQSDIDKHK